MLLITPRAHKPTFRIPFLQACWVVYVSQSLMQNYSGSAMLQLLFLGEGGRQRSKRDTIFFYFASSLIDLLQIMSNTFTLDDYLHPAWSAQPTFKYYFEIIKDGCVLGKLPIRQKSFNLVGRLQDLCDVAIDNQTVSRKHAILQAKVNDPCLYLYDLGSAHGTFVNKQRLPVRTYKKLSPFDNVKFGVSSRIFVLRCPQHEQLMDSEQAQNDNKFAEIIQNQHRQLSKQELKDRYLDLLQNDPYFAANQAPRKLLGREKIQEQDEYEGIDWGITDQREVYGHRFESDIPIEPDLLRRLDLDQTQLNKLADYEDHLRKYQQVQAELNELTSREKREFGLQQKLQSKKQKLEKRFMEALETVEKSEDWLRSNIFGERVDRDKKNILKIREKENDTFGDDEYFDRTLQNREGKREAVEGEISTQDYWKLQKQLKDHIKSLDQLKEKMEEVQGRSQNPILTTMSQESREQEEDELEAFMKDNNMSLDNENMAILRREEEILTAKIQHLKSIFKTIMGEEQLRRMAAPVKVLHRTLKQDFKQKSLEESLLQTKKKMQQNQSLQNILSRLQAANAEDQEVNEMDPSIFNYYKGKQQQQEQQDIDLDDQKITRKRQPPNYNPQKFQKPLSKHVSFDTIDKKGKAEMEDEEVIDLTRKFQ